MSEENKFFIKVSIGKGGPSFRCENTFDLTRVLDRIGYGRVHQNGKYEFILDEKLYLFCFDKITNKKLGGKVLTNNQYFKPHSDLFLAYEMDEICLGIENPLK